jgi:hypothetical protein
MPVSPFANPDPSADVPRTGCGCGAEGHALLKLFLTGKLALVSNLESRCPTRDRHRLSGSGLITLIEGAQGGWPRGWWTASLTAAGYAHAADLADLSAIHAGAGGCGRPWRSDGFCSGCHEPRPLTVNLARAIIAAIADPKARAEAVYASQFVCSRHGRARMEMVRTDKNCAACGEGFRRDYRLG